MGEEMWYSGGHGNGGCGADGSGYGLFSNGVVVGGVHCVADFGVEMNWSKILKKNQGLLNDLDRVSGIAHEIFVAQGWTWARYHDGRREEYTPSKEEIKRNYESMVAMAKKRTRFVYGGRLTVIFIRCDKEMLFHISP